MEQTLETCRRFYNDCLAERKTAYEERAESINKYAQLRKVKEIKANDPYAKNVHSHVLQTVVADLDKAFQAFFRRVSMGEKPGYPRFKGANRFDSFGFKEYGNGFKFDGRRLKLSGIGRVAVRWHRPVEGKIKTVRIVRKAGNRWFVSFAVELPEKLLPATGQVVGVDIGIKSLLATSDGEFVENPHFYRESQARLRVIQRSVSRKNKGGKNRRKAVVLLQKHHEHIKNQRKDYLNKGIFSLIQRYDLIALEDLQINNMVKNHNLSKSILDSGWGFLKQRLTNKAAEAGRELVLVNPAYTSKTCSSCGVVFENFDLSVRWMECSCGLSINRDVNAAINILNKALKNWTGHVRWELTRAVAPCVSQEAASL